jgi:endonuclease G
MKKRSGFLLLTGLTVALLQAFGQVTTANSQSATNHLTLGNPSNASNTSSSNYLLQKSQYVLSYNKDKGIPNWVSWQLNKSWLGTAPRQNDFRPDEQLPTSWYHVKPSDYTNSGYDRGHMTPSADRSNTISNNSATFLMTNILPQAPDNNQGPWNDLEEYCRTLVTKQGKELYIISGGYGTQGKIANGKVSVPTKVWKVIVVLDGPGLGVKGVTPKTRTIAVMMPNSNQVKNTKWTQYKTTVRQIESATRYDFLSNVPKSVQDAIETRVDNY